MIIVDITVTKVLSWDQTTKHYRLECNSMFEANKLIERMSAGSNTVAAFIERI